MTCLDVHTHLHPPRLFAAIRRWFAEHSDWAIGHQPTEPHHVARALREAGVDKFVYFSYAHRPGIARELNAWLAHTALQLGGAGLPLGTVHLDDPDPRADVELALEAGCAGIKIHEDVQNLAIDDARWKPVFEAIAAREGTVLVHAGRIPWSDDTNDGPTRIASVLDEHPALNVIVAHLGAPDTGRYFAMMDRYPRLHLDTTMAVANGSPMQRPAIACDFEQHAERVLYGTDFPNIPYEYGAERDAIEAMGLSERALRRIEGENAQTLFGRFFAALERRIADSLTSS